MMKQKRGDHKNNHFNAKVYTAIAGISGILATGFSLHNPIMNESGKKKKPKIIIIDGEDLEDDDDEEEESDEEREERLEKERQKRILNKPPLSQVFNISDFEYIAKQRLRFRLRFRNISIHVHGQFII